MSVTAKLNLDYLCATHAQKLVRATMQKKIEPGSLDNTVTKSLGVLVEDGVYACFLFLKSRYGEEQGLPEMLVEEMLGLLDELGYGKPVRTEEILGFISEKITGGSLERLLLAKENLEQMLIYARYGAKAEKTGEV